MTRTEPSQGTTVAEGTRIVVFYSDGREKVPNLVGKQQGEAENAVRNAGFEPRVIQSSDTTEPVATDAITATTPDTTEPTVVM